MSLLWMDYDPEFHDIVDTAFECEREERPEYFAGMSEKVKNIIYRDTRYNIDFLYTAYTLGEDRIMSDYAAWLFGLMDPILKFDTGDMTADYVIEHFECIKRAAQKVVGSDDEKHMRLREIMDIAQKRVRECAVREPRLRSSDLTDTQEASEYDGSYSVSVYENEIKQYMDHLMKKNTKKTVYLVRGFIERGIPVSDVYVEILAESMRRVGELWHESKISVDTEHYCTSVTQMAMAQMYPELFSAERKNRTILCACPGTELHEMGARMVADIFENGGWDSIYLGAAVPKDAMLAAIRENEPDVVSLSVTMPQHLIACRDMIYAVREEFPDIVIAVGGQAFRSTDDIWAHWPVDIYSEDAREFLEKADRIRDGIEDR